MPQAGRRSHPCSFLTFLVFPGRGALLGGKLRLLGAALDKQRTRIVKVAGIWLESSPGL